MKLFGPIKNIFRGFINTASATIKHREKYGHEATDSLLDQCMFKIKEILEKDDNIREDALEVDITNDIVLVTSRNQMK